MKSFKQFGFPLVLFSCAMLKELGDMPGKEMLVITVAYPPEAVLAAD